MKSVGLVKIDSDLRVYGTNESFTYNFERDIAFRHPRLLYANIPQTYYNVRSAVSLPVNDGAGGMITIPAGNYTISELCSTIQSSLIASGDAGHTVSFNSITMRVSFTNTTPTNFSLNFLTGGEDELARLLGFEYADYTGAASYTGTLTPQTVEQEFYINIPELGLNVDGASHTQRCTFVIPAAGIRGDYLQYATQNYFEQESNIDQAILHSFTVELRRRDGLLVDLNGANWNIILSTGY